MENGWIKLHRKLLENPIAQKPNYLALWVTILLKANHKDFKHMFNGEFIIIKEGQLITGRKALSKQTGIPETTIERILKTLENGHQIGQQKNNKFRLITVLNWKSYQDEWTPKRTSNGHQTDTNNNDKNDNKYSKSNDLPRTPLEELTYEPLEGNKTKGAFLDRARAKKGKPPMLKKDPSTWDIINLYKKQYRYIRGKYPIVCDADYFHVLSITKKMSPQDMEKMVIWYVKEENKKFKDHPNLKSIFTPENINKFNAEN